MTLVAYWATIEMCVYILYIHIYLAITMAVVNMNTNTRHRSQVKVTASRHLIIHFMIVSVNSFFFIITELFKANTSLNACL